MIQNETTALEDRRVNSPDAYTRIEAEDSLNAGPEVNKTHSRSPDGSHALNIVISSDHTVYERVEFGSILARLFTARLASDIPDGARGVIEVRLDNPRSRPIGRISVPSAGGRKQEVRPVEPTRGEHRVFSKSISSAGQAPALSLDWFTFRH